MTACILSGFAKKKKYVGTVYACDGSDLPATQDFGTVQFSGPFESAQTVPATEVTYTIIGKTQCGDDIRRITTRTYSSRVLPNYNKSVGNITLSPGLNGIPSCPIPEFTARNGVIGYGATADLARAVNWLLAWTVAQDSDDLYDVGTAACYPITKNAFTNSAFVQYSGHPSSPITVIQYVETSNSVVTIYYLDVHEVWTYDLV